MGLKITTQITGVRRCLQTLKMMDAGTRLRCRDAVQVTTAAVEARAKQNVPVSGPEDRKATNRPGPGELRDTIRSSYSLDGLAGFVMAGFGKLQRRSRAKTAKGRARANARLRAKRQRLGIDLGVYAMVIEYGSPGRGIPGSRYMTRAKEAERMAHIRRIQNALAQAADAADRGVAT